MIKAEELRIGNLVSFLSNELTTIQIKSIIPEKGTHELYEPIPLTEDWLIKFGFNMVNAMDGGNAFEIPSWGRIMLINGILKSDQYYFLDGLTAKIQYVHQLQNLYFVLTGTELIYKP